MVSVSHYHTTNPFTLSPLLLCINKSVLNKLKQAVEREKGSEEERGLVEVLGSRSLNLLWGFWFVLNGRTDDVVRPSH
ncbi:hypothetical protein LWI28_010492 [Acer negundo]|uniref:Uncharacterized protein n=1 Tax=Acer negundo TaxID=4023 RepID=A0AAD5IL80_ACENE|nr:hypothetical protein LWI28_010492 [Acer negundo]